MELIATRPTSSVQCITGLHQQLLEIIKTKFNNGAGQALHYEENGQHWIVTWASDRYGPFRYVMDADQMMLRLYEASRQFPKR